MTVRTRWVGTSDMVLMLAAAAASAGLDDAAGMSVRMGAEGFIRVRSTMQAQNPAANITGKCP